MMFGLHVSTSVVTLKIYVLEFPAGLCGISAQPLELSQVELGG